MNLENTQFFLRKNIQNILLSLVVLALVLNLYLITSLDQRIRYIDCVSEYELSDLQSSIDGQEDVLEEIQSDVIDIHIEVMSRQ